ncbi:hypothetical protein [Synechocystis sp. LKSZ1]|uniref:hypothetical protein n=1 Tax=Synechocystis sp. LKSZ1 TaxID=3144951 RepID=UPI00336BF6E8
MQTPIDRPSKLEPDLLHQAPPTKIPFQALSQTPGPSSIPTTQWPETVLSYEGSQDFPAFESYRTELLLPSEPEIRNTLICYFDVYAVSNGSFS